MAPENIKDSFIFKHFIENSYCHVTDKTKLFYFVIEKRQGEHQHTTNTALELIFIELN